MKGLLTVVALLVLGGGGWMVKRQHDAMVALRAGNAELALEAAKVDAVEAEVTELRALEVDPEELRRLRADHGELLRLRGEATRLRATARDGAKDLENRLAGLQRQAVVSSERGEAIEAGQEARAASRLMLERMETYLSILLEASGERLATSPEELRARIAAFEIEDEVKAYWIDLLNGAGKGPAMRTFIEFVPGTGVPTADGPERMLLRERTARTLPDGTFARVYGTTRGRYAELRSPTEDFSDAEASMLAP